MWLIPVLLMCIALVTEGSIELNGRIVGGTASFIEVHPHQLSLHHFGGHICGASIISVSYGLTAAHCVEGKEVKDLSVNAGSNLYYYGGTRRKLESVRMHELYDTDTTDYDIAIIKFQIALTFSKKISPVRLPPSGYSPPVGALGVVSGWGYTTEDDEHVSDVLLSVSIPVVGRLRCQQLYSGKGVVTPRMICAGRTTGGLDACQGDSGGGFTINGLLAGIVSWGYGCARPRYPGIYTNVAFFRKWIKRYTNV